jgi:hypothetical protein
MLVRKFVEGRGRGPTPEEYEKLVALWTKNEVMYREALSLGLDKGDEMIRSRIILKMRNLVYGNIVIREPDPGELQAWLEAHRERYELPRRFDLEQVELGAGDDAAAVLSATRDADAVPAAYADQLRRCRGRSRAAVAATFGDDFAEALARAARGEWVLLDSEDGRHLARVTAVHEAVPATLESRRGRIEADWRDAQAQLSVMDQLAEIRSRYVLRRKDSPAGAKADAQEALTESRG